MTYPYARALGVILDVLKARQAMGNLDTEDYAVISVLVALTRAVEGKRSLSELAVACFEFDRSAEPEPAGAGR